MDRLGVANEPLTAGARKASLDPGVRLMTKPRPFCMVSYSTKCMTSLSMMSKPGVKESYFRVNRRTKNSSTGAFLAGDRAKQFGLIDDTATSTEVRERLSIVYGTTRFRDYNAQKHR